MRHVLPRFIESLRWTVFRVNDAWSDQQPKGLLNSVQQLQDLFEALPILVSFVNYFSPISQGDPQYKAKMRGLNFCHVEQFRLN